jgi:putative spermidine/putrescine transport system substrate-binding protein
VSRVFLRCRRIGLPVVAAGLLLAACAAPSNVSAAPPASSWDSVLTAAKGQTVNLWMYGGDQQGDHYVDDVLAPAAAKLGVTIHRVPITDTKDALNRMLAEKQAGRTGDGSVDLVWVNGDNFRTGQQAGLWACGWVSSLPNSKYLDPADSLLANDFGVPTNGCEAPWHKAQFTFFYDSAKVTDPPTTMAGLFSWITRHPGKFTYPAPPDFTGSVFVREALYAVSGGVANVPLQFSQTDYSRLTPALYAKLTSLAPSMWRAGATYPRDSTELDKLYSGGQVDFDMTYGPATLTSLVSNGTFPASTKILTLDEGTVGNASFLGMPANAADRAGAEVVANLALSPAQQLAKADPKVWGQFTVLDLSRLDAAAKSAFAALPVSSVVPGYDVLSRNANSELSSAWVDPINTGWRQAVLGAG